MGHNLSNPQFAGKPIDKYVIASIPLCGIRATKYAVVSTEESFFENGLLGQPDDQI